MANPWTKDDFHRFKMALSQFPADKDGSFDHISNYLGRTLEETIQFYSEHMVEKDDENRVEKDNENQATITLTHPHDNKWERIALSLKVPVQDLKDYYFFLNEDLNAITAGYVPPNYFRHNNRTTLGSTSNLPFHSDSGSPRVTVPTGTGAEGITLVSPEPQNPVLPNTSSTQQKNKGPWTPEEHSNFVRGYEARGGPKWSEIAKYSVPTRSHYQVRDHGNTFLSKKNSNTKLSL